MGYILETKGQWSTWSTWKKGSPSLFSYSTNQSERNDSVPLVKPEQILLFERCPETKGGSSNDARLESKDIASESAWKYGGCVMIPQSQENPPSCFCDVPVNKLDKCSGSVTQRCEGRFFFTWGRQKTKGQRRETVYGEQFPLLGFCWSTWGKELVGAEVRQEKEKKVNFLFQIVRKEVTGGWDYYLMSLCFSWIKGWKLLAEAYCRFVKMLMNSRVFLFLWFAGFDLVSLQRPNSFYAVLKSLNYVVKSN